MFLLSCFRLIQQNRLLHPRDLRKTQIIFFRTHKIGEKRRAYKYHGIQICIEQLTI